MMTIKREITNKKDVTLNKVSDIHTAGPILEPGKWAENDPFLLMMEDKFQKGSFDKHPHRGMETVTFVIEGQIEHYDNYTGDGGILQAGDVQWMTAGGGVVHNEVPSEGIIAHSLQLWVNLPKDKKMTKPRYQNLKSADMPVRKEEGASIRVFSGSSKDVVSETKNHVPITMVEMVIEPGKTVTQDMPNNYKGFLYILEGSGEFGSNRVSASQGQVLFFDEGNDDQESELELTAIEPLRIVLYAGKPLREPVVARGPFVMNTEQEIQEAYQDYQKGQFFRGV